MTTKQLYLGILHYHWLCGGVRTVAGNLIRSLLAFGSPDRIHIDLIACDSEQEPGRNFVREIDQWTQSHGRVPYAIRPVQVPQLAYQDQPAASRQVLVQEATQLVEALLKRIDLQNVDCERPYILNPHNGNLGKNPTLTLALKRLAERIVRENLPIRILYQMHDFAEDRRPACWQALAQAGCQYDPEFACEIMYPTSSAIHWVFINSPDRDKAVEMGLPAESVSLLPNAIDHDVFATPSVLAATGEQLRSWGLQKRDYRTDLKDRIGAYAAEQDYVFDPQRMILLSPVKILRRKNIIESLLLLLHRNYLDDRFQLFITLEANSPEDRAYSETIVDFVRTHRLPVVIGFGERLSGHQRIVKNGQVESYSLIDLMILSKAVVVTSIQEGFGYAFHEPWLAGRAVLGRDLPHVTGDFKAAGLDLRHLYRRLLIPRVWLGDWAAALVDQYIRKIHQHRRDTALESLTDEQARAAIEAAKIVRIPSADDAFLDFADLDSRTQLLVLEKIMAEPTLCEQLVFQDQQNGRLADWYREDLSDTIAGNRRTVGESYGLAAKAQRFEAILTRFGEPLVSPRQNEVLSNRILFEKALSPEHLNLLV